MSTTCCLTRVSGVAQGLLAKEGSTHIGIRATTYSSQDFHDSDAMGIATLTAED